MLRALLSHSVPEISAENLAKLDNVLVLDAREYPEYAVSHLPGAVWVGYNDFNPARIPQIDAGKTVVVYCSVGYRSEKIAEKICAIHKENVYNLYGGIFEWANQNRPLTDSMNMPTRTVHAYNRIWGLWLNRSEKVYD